MAIYWVYERATGKYAGSGTVPIEDETYASTTIPIPEHEAPAPPEWHFVEETGKWELRNPAG